MSMVSDIRETILASRGADRWDGYVNMLKILKNAFSSERHWILEFLQNAEDARAKRLTIKISNDGLLILNDGEPFGENDVRAICDVRSRKLLHLGFRGWLGIGFKSIFRVSSRVEVHSGDLHFAFDRQHWAARNWEGAASGAEWPWEILPVECGSLELPDRYTTAFWIPTSDGVAPILKRLAEFLGGDQLPSEMVLLLEAVETIGVHLTGGALHIRKAHLEESEHGAGTYRLRAQRVLVEVLGEGDLDRRSSKVGYLVLRANRPVPDNVRNSPETEEIRRSQVSSREIGLVFGLEDGSGLGYLPSRLGGLYSFLPLETEQTGLPFGLFADFVPHPNRVTVNEGLRWNHWLRDEVAKLLQQSIEHLFLAEEQWKFVPFRLFTWLREPRPIDAATRFWAEGVRDPLRQFLAEGAFYPDRDGVLRRLADLAHVEHEVETVLGEDALSALLQGRHLAHPDVVRELRSEITMVGLYDLIQEHRSALETLRTKPEKLAAVYSLASDSDKLSNYQIRGRDTRDPPLDLVSWALGADGNWHAPNRTVHVTLDMPSQPKFVDAIVRKIVNNAETTLHGVVARDDSAVRGLQRCGLRVVDKRNLVWETQRQIEAIHERSDCPDDWDFPGDLIYATLFVAKESPHYRPKRLVGEDGHPYDPNLLFIRGGPLDWSVAQDQGLLPGYSVLHPGYVSESTAAALRTDLPTVRGWLLDVGVHGFDPVRDRALTERAGYTLATKQLEAEGHQVEYVANRLELGHDLECREHCASVFEVKSMTNPGDISLEQSQVREAKYRAQDYVLVIVYGLPWQAVLGQLRNPSRVWEPDERARIPLDSWRREL